MGYFANSQIILISWISLIQILLISSFSRKHPMTEGLGLVGVVSYISVYHIVWNAFLMVSVWQGDEQIFNWTITPWLPSVTFYLAAFGLLIVLGLLITVWLSHRPYSLRQRILYSMASAVTMIGTLQAMKIPLDLQSFISKITQQP